MRRRWGIAALLVSALLLAGCINDSGNDPAIEPLAPRTSAPTIRLGDITVGSTALAQRAGLYICGDRIVASAPAGGIEGDSFVVFDRETGAGHITQVRLPRGVHPNARWLMTTECVDTGGKPFISVAYQQMPLTPEGGGGGVRAAYSLDGEKLWMRRDINQPGVVVDDVLVLGPAPEQPETAVDLRNGRTIATFDPSVEARTIVSGNRMVVRRLAGPPVLTTLTGRKVATLRQASSFSADGRYLFGTIPAALPDAGQSGEPTTDQDPGRLTDASPSPSPTNTPSPGSPSALARGGSVRAYSLRTGKPAWRLNIAPDPLLAPVVEPQTGVAVIVDAQGLVHGVNTSEGRQVWRTPSELKNPRVTAASGMVLFDTVDDSFQKLVDARTGLPLPEPVEAIVDLHAPGGLQIVDGVPTMVPAQRLRNPPASATDGPID